MNEHQRYDLYVMCDIIVSFESQFYFWKCFKQKKSLWNKLKNCSTSSLFSVFFPIEPKIRNNQFNRASDRETKGEEIMLSVCVFVSILHQIFLELYHF